MTSISMLKKLQFRPTSRLTRWVHATGYYIAVHHGKMPPKDKRATSEFTWDYRVASNGQIDYHFSCHGCGRLLHSDSGELLRQTEFYGKVPRYVLLTTLEECVVCNNCGTHVWPVLVDYNEVAPKIKRDREKFQLQSQSAARKKLHPAQAQ